MLKDLSSEKRVVGIKQLRRALADHQAKQVFLARDADPALIEPIETFCKENHVLYQFVPTMRELGQACGICVGAAAAATLQ